MIEIEEVPLPVPEQTISTDEAALASVLFEALSRAGFDAEIEWIGDGLHVLSFHGSRIEATDFLQAARLRLPE